MSKHIGLCYSILCRILQYFTVNMLTVVDCKKKYTLLPVNYCKIYSHFLTMKSLAKSHRIFWSAAIKTYIQSSFIMIIIQYIQYTAPKLPLVLDPNINYTPNASLSKHWSLTLLRKAAFSQLPPPKKKKYLWSEIYLLSLDDSGKQAEAPDSKD